MKMTKGSAGDVDRRWCMSIGTMLAIGAVITIVFLLAILVFMFLKQGASFSMALRFPGQKGEMDTTERIN